jgi:pyruvate kinase
MLDAIARQVEGSLWTEGAFGSITHNDALPPPLPLPTAIGRSIAQLSRDLRVRCIVVPSPGDGTAMAVAAARPAAPTIAASPDAAACRRANLLWGTVPVQVDPTDLVDPACAARRLAVERGFSAAGHYILMVAGLQPGRTDSSPSISVLSV